MTMSWRYTPPSGDAVLLMRAAAVAAVDEVAQRVYDDSQSLVPVDTGRLKNSGRVGSEGLVAGVGYTGVNPDDGFDYGLKVHEDLSASHPNGGQAKFLEIPLHQHARDLEAALAAAVSRLL